VNDRAFGASLERRVADFYRRNGALVLKSKAAVRAIKTRAGRLRWVNRPQDFWSIGDLIVLPPPRTFPDAPSRRRAPRLVSVSTFNNRSNRIRKILTAVPRPSEFTPPPPGAPPRTAFMTLIERDWEIELWCLRPPSKEKPKPLWVVQRWERSMCAEGLAHSQGFELPRTLARFVPPGWTEDEARPSPPLRRLKAGGRS
jgi:hypothetical protein